jgi:thymidylate synthase (FAD)
MAASFDWYHDSINETNASLKLIELAGRTCYKSEDKITPDSSQKFIQKLLKLKHESVLEHSAMTVRFICDRGVSHELVRHRIASFSQESTRYCNYGEGITFIIPPFFPVEEGEYKFVRDSMIHGVEEWMSAMLAAEETYIWMIKNSIPPQQARSVLPNSLKTEIVVTANFREWRHIFNLRCSEKAHPQMRELMIPLRDNCRRLIPVIFD